MAASRISPHPQHQLGHRFAAANLSQLAAEQPVGIGGDLLLAGILVFVDLLHDHGLHVVAQELFHVHERQSNGKGVSGEAGAPGRRRTLGSFGLDVRNFAVYNRAMPAGGQPLGLVYFAFVKFAGYSAFCRVIVQPRCAEFAGDRKEIPSAWKAGAVRTAIGLILGAIVGLGFWKIPWFSHSDAFDTPLFFLILIPVRIGEWTLLLRWIYRRFDFDTRQSSTIIAIGILTSFALDGLGVLTAFVLPGGVWVC